ncbi:MAG TPA: right-handed parallel beta-helix repeat-containing protein [Terriglobales bacterium]|nr:right-handed parallel beta-helix repeat-containing protein [Terriglobales bacterium]
MSRMNLLNLFTIVLLATALTSAQASRTWVSGVGDDAFPCSRTAPCKTFAGAISKTAVGGEIDALDPGGFGAVTITKAITIDGGGGQVASVLVSGGINGIVVQAGANDIVTIRNIRINGVDQNPQVGGGLNGIRWTSGKALHIENCVIFGFTNNGIDIAKSDGGKAFILDTIVQDNTQNGVQATDTVNTVSVVVDNSRFENNGHDGMFAADFSNFSVSRSDASGNVNGFAAQAAGGNAVISLANSTAGLNSNVGLFAGTAATVRIEGVSLFDNAGAGMSTAGGGAIVTFLNNYNTLGGAPTGSIMPQ